MGSLDKTQKLLNISISLFIIAFILYILYKNKKIKNKSKDTLKRTNLNGQSLKREKTSLIKPSTYKFGVSKPIGIKERLETVEFKLFSYSDLIRIVETNDIGFYSKYCSSVKAMLDYKEPIYEKKLLEAENTAASKKVEGALSAHDEVLHSINKEIEQYRDILKHITIIKASLTPQKLHNNFTDMLWNKNKGLELMVGRIEFKDFIARKIHAFMKSPTSFCKSFNNGLVLGSSGMGKDRLAISQAHSYHMAYLTIRPGYLMESKDSITSAFIGGTGIKTRSVLLDSLEKVLYLNEIYGLVNKDPFKTNYGIEAINQIVFFADAFRGCSFIYGIGYEEETLDSFLRSNEGMDRRFPQENRLVLKSYTNDELTQILLRQLEDGGFPIFTPSEAEYLYSLISTVATFRPQVFRVQAGAMQEISAAILSFRSNVQNIEWRSGDEKNNKAFIKLALEDYMHKYYNFVFDESS